MTRQDLLKLARRYLIADDGANESNLVRKIQIAEGHVACFATGRTSCAETGCKWRAECLAEPELSTADCRKD